MTSDLPLFNTLTPFMLEGGAVRGRVVRLGSVTETILSRHDYPPHVARLLAELLVAASMLSANLQPEGIFTIQVRGQGMVPLVVVDAVYGGQLRGYADVQPDMIESINALETYSPRALVGEGAYFAITFDAGKDKRYQGIVSLEGDSVADALMAYFTNSEQLQVGVQFATGSDGHWTAAGLMIERMPDIPGTDIDETWRYAKAVTGTVTDEELLDPLLDAPALLYRLFHEQGVWVYDPHTMSVGCRCSRERIITILTGMNLEDRADMVVDGRVEVHCQFCNKTEVFLPGDIGLSAGN